jgi:hypothetical protein
MIHDHVVATNAGTVRTNEFKCFDPDGLSDEDSEPFVVGAAFRMMGVRGTAPDSATVADAHRDLTGEAVFEVGE